LIVAGGLAPFRSRNFSIMFAGALLSNIGTWMEGVALSYYVADTTGKASWSAIVAAAAFVPSAVIGPIGSAMADRLNRRRVLMVGSVVQGAIAAVLAVWVGGGTATPLGITIVSFIAGCVSAFVFPSFQTTLPDLVPRDQLVAAVGISNAQWNLGRIIGPSLAAGAIAIGGIGLALWCNAVSFLFVGLAVLVVKVPQRFGERRAVFASLADGIRFARGNAEMRSMLVVMIAVVLIASPFIAFVSQMATNVFDGEASATSLLVTAQGVGAVIAAFSLGAVSARFGLRQLMAWASAALCVALAAYGYAPVIWLSAIALAVVGLTYGWAFTSFAGVAQRAAPDEMRGRVMAVNMFVLGLGHPVGTLVQGQLADASSLRAVTAGSGVLLAGVLAVVLRRRRPAQATVIVT
jgi:MFS family permease